MTNTREFLVFSCWLMAVLVYGLTQAQSHQPCPDNGHDLNLCYCTWEGGEITVVNCTNTFFMDDSLLQTLPISAPFVQKIIFTGNQIDELSPNIFGLCSTKSMLNLKYLDLSNNDIRIIHGQTFHCIPNLETLILSDNLWIADDQNNARVFSSIYCLRSLYLENAFGIPDSRDENTHLVHLRNIFSTAPMDCLQDLHLGKNGFQYVDEDLFCERNSLPRLRRLYLNDNGFKKINIKCLGRLEELHLERNEIAYLSDNDINVVQNITTLTKLTLDGNTFQCTDCDDHMVKFRDWLASPAGEIVYDRLQLNCSFPDKLKDKRILNVTNGNMGGTCTTGVEVRRGKEMKIVIATMVILSLFLVAIILVVIHREQIRYYDWECCRAMKRKARGLVAKQETIQYTYDAMTDEEMFSIEAEEA